MQIERMVKDPEYARQQFKRGGAFFQLMTEGVLTTDEIKALAPAIAADVVYITSKRLTFPPGVAAVLEALEKHAFDCAVPLAAFTLGMMLGVGHERWRVKDPQSKRLQKAARRKGARA